MCWLGTMPSLKTESELMDPASPGSFRGWQTCGMQHAEQVRLLKQLLAHIEAGTTVDTGKVSQLATATYTDAGLSAVVTFTIRPSPSAPSMGTMHVSRPAESFALCHRHMTG
jgi:hypothetical protein